jgi:uncharacterized protein YutE (UPF0331/DUF86 family)
MDEIVFERLVLLRNEIAFLKHERDSVRTYDAYVDDARLRRAVERSLQVSVEIMLDVARRLIALKSLRFPTDNQDAFQVLAEGKIVPPELLPTLQEMARFRNLLVHEYAKIDDARVYGILKRRLGDFDDYAKAIAAYITGE